MSLRTPALLLVAGASAAAQTPITSLPATISAPGKYILASNFTTNITSGAAITITAQSAVDLDLGGYVIDNPPPSNTAYSYISGISSGTITSLRVHNGTLRGFGRGVYTNGPQIEISDLTISNCQNGIYVMGPNARIHGNTISSLSGAPWYNVVGIYASGQGLHIHDNVIQGITGQPSNALMSIGIGVNNIYGAPGTTGLIENNQVDNATGTMGQAIAIWNASAVNVLGNHVFNMNYGVFNSGAGVVKAGSNVFDNVATGLYAVTDIGNNH